MAREIDLMLLRGFSLCTYEILYHLPDHPALLQTFVLQRYDQDPEFPELRKFLDFWRGNIHGRLHSVRVASQRMIRPAELRVAAEFALN